VKLDLDETLSSFETIKSVGDAREISQPLLTTAGAAIAARDPRFRDGLSNLTRIVFQGECPDRIDALALVWRMTSVSAMREHRRTLVAHLSDLNRPFQELPTILKDPDDRRYLADALQAVRLPWVAEYAADAITTEREGEKARLGFCRALVQATNDSAQQLVLLSDSFRKLKFSQHDPNTGRARRFAAVLNGLSEALWSNESDQPAGDEFGSAFARFVSAAVGYGEVAEKQAHIQAAAAALKYVRTVVRLHGTLAADAKTYQFVGPLKRSFGARWPSSVLPDVQTVANQVSEQLLFLLKQRIPDEQLRETLFLLLDPAGAKASLNDVVARATGLGPEDAHWLLTGAYPRRLATQAAVEETALASAVDRELGLALREADAILGALEPLGSELVSHADSHSSRLASQTTRLLDRVRKLTNHIISISKRRGLELRGRAGEVVEFRPTEHDADAGAIGARTVRLKNRIVERVVDGKPVGILVRAEVERV
jgi:hypothetical protein